MINEAVKLPLAIVILTVMIFFMVQLFPSFYDEADETAESYFKNLEYAISLADLGKEGEFFMLDNGKSDLNFYLVYFGGALGVGKEVKFWQSDRQFVLKNFEGDNVLCVCSEKDKIILCRYCKGLESQSKFNNTAPKSWVVNEGVRMKVKKDGVMYDFFPW